MLVKIGGYHNPVPKVVYVDQLRHRREVLGVADVGLGERHPAVGPLPHGLLLGLLLTLRPGDMWLHHAWHGARVLVLLPCPFLKLSHEHLYLLVRSAHGDDPIAQAARPLAHDGARGRNVDGGWSLRHGVELRALELYVLARVLHHLAGEELADDLDGLYQYPEPRGRLGPVVTDDVLVECLAGPEPEPEATRVHSLQGSGGLGDDRRVVAEARRGYTSPEA